MIEIVEEFAVLVKELRAADIDYAVCGGLAVMIHGFVRATEDIDLLIEAESLPRMVKLAAGLGFRQRARELVFRSGMKVFRLLKLSTDSDDYLILDLMLVNDVTRAAWESRLDVPTQWGPVRAVSRDALLAMKRQAGRPQDLFDVERMEKPDGEH